jgi:prepilin-type N-terminal cleavage/methylation domain-containing protein
VIGGDGEAGYSLIELVIVMVILTVVIGAIVSLFTAGINADADQNRRFQSQQDARLALDTLRRQLHSGCTVSNPSSYNTPESAVTVYFGSDSCVSGAHTVTWCTTGSGSNYTLNRVVGTSCTGSMRAYADHLTSGNIFIYLPPNSHLVTSSSLGLGTTSSYIVTVDGSATLPRIHVDLTSKHGSRANDAFRLVDDIALRNARRACDAGVVSC